MKVRITGYALTSHESYMDFAELDERGLSVFLHRCLIGQSEDTSTEAAVLTIVQRELTAASAERARFAFIASLLGKILEVP